MNFERHYLPFVSLMMFGGGVFVITICINWAVMFTNNPEQYRIDLGEVYLSQVVLSLGVAFGLGIFMIIWWGSKLYSAALEKMKEN